MQGSYTRNLYTPAQWKLKIINVKVNQVKRFRVIKNLFHHQGVMGNGINAIGIESERFFAYGNQSRVGYRVAAGKQGYVMPNGD
jgi:hypothetical protein